jgi:hypothetical protein
LSKIVAAECRNPLAIAPSELNQLVKPTDPLEEGVGQVEREGRAISLLPGFEKSRSWRILERKSGFLVERWLDLGKRVLQIPMLVGK